MNRTEMLELIKAIAGELDQAALDFIIFEYGVDLSAPEHHTDEELEDVINAWSDFGKGFDY